MVRDGIELRLHRRRVLALLNAMKPITLPPTLHPSHPDYARERYSPAQAALYLEMSVEQVYRLVAAGVIAYRRAAAQRSRAQGVRRTRGRIHFSQADLDAWRRASRCEPLPASHTPTALDGDMPKVLRFA